MAEADLRRRYEVISIINDFFIAIWFLVRPTIRLISHIHIQRIPASNWES